MIGRLIMTIRLAVTRGVTVGILVLVLNRWTPPPNGLLC
jgi:hypothetical protein